MAHRRSTVAVVVLGDLGRSPRMQYHALSLAEHVGDVDLIGLEGRPPIDPVAQHPNIAIQRIADPPRTPVAGSAKRLILGAWRVGRQFLQLAHTLLRPARRPDIILVQTPPAVPTLPIAWLAARVYGARLVIDWHNFGHTILALSFGPTHPAVRFTRWIEGVFARRGDAHLCVSSAMAAELRSRWGVEAVVVHDRPGPGFTPFALDQREATLARHGVTPPRPAVLVSSTSWTPDEDFSVLLDAAVEIDRRLDAAENASTDPQLLVYICGEGLGRADFEARAAALSLRRVVLRTGWLPWDDYRALLASADLGLCLHKSSSGVDLPMKILDMFGCGLPVVAFDYGSCLRELVHPDENGALFRDASELSELLWQLLLTGDTELLERLRRGAVLEAANDWGHHWRAVTQRVLQSLS